VFRLGFPTSCLLDFYGAGEDNWGRGTAVRVGATPTGLTAPPPPQPPSFFTGWMPFLPPNQQCQSTVGLCLSRILTLSPPLTCSSKLGEFSRLESWSQDVLRPSFPKSWSWDTEFRDLGTSESWSWIIESWVQVSVPEKVIQSLEQCLLVCKVWLLNCELLLSNKQLMSLSNNWVTD